MECNKDEAEKAKLIAETKLSGKDYPGAKKYALKAKTLYPELDGISQMLTILDVYTSAENKLHGEGDWYGVLGVTPYADGETIKKAYKKLALILHPDKNKLVGADGAFKYVCDAWSLLSDKAKRLAYNQKRKHKVAPKTGSSQTGVTPPPFKSNDSHKYAGQTTASARGNHSISSQSGAKAAAEKNDTFWTICKGCKTHFEYLRKYLNQKLLCPNCKVPFLAVEKHCPQMAMPVYMFSNQHAQSSFQKNGTVSSGKDSVSGKRAGSSTLNSYHMKKSRNDPLSGMQNPVGTHYPHVPASNHQSMDRERQMSNEAQQTARLQRIHVQTKLSGVFSSFIHTPNSTATAGHAGHVNGRMGLNNFTNAYDRDKTKSGYGHKELPVMGARALLISMATSEIQKQLTEWCLATEAKTAERINLKKKDGKKGMLHSSDGNGLKYPTKINVPEAGSKGHKENMTHSVDDVDADDAEQNSMTVPDPDFHNFDMDRTERSFGENEVWASYDDDDGMPRFYALIHKVVNTHPFKLKISWLNSKSSSEFGSSNWVDCGFSKTCGIFRIGKHETYSLLNSFSHKVAWTRVRGAVNIFPKKGDVWALYKNWSSNWDENTPDEILHKYDMVELLDDYNEVQGVSVVPLIKVPGFRTVFHAAADPNAVKKIVKEEMFRFSHQIPHYVITGKEAENAPKGCRELDPAATPIEFLQVLSESKNIGGTSFAEKTVFLKNKISL